MNKWDNYFINVAYETAKLSYATRLKVGAVAVIDRRIICCGFNGTAPGRENSCEINNLTKDETLHAEQNLISFAAREGIKLKSAVVYLTHSPCLKCASMLLSAGISGVYYAEKYRSQEGVEYLLDSGIDVIELIYNKEK